MKKLISLTACAVAALLFTFGTAKVAAGGWAISSLDAFDQPVAGQPTVIGFTILQHGVTPVDLDDVGIRVFEAGTSAAYFPAVADGPQRVGHYTAQVVFPAEGTFTWLVEQGFFGPQDLGQITIGDTSSLRLAARSSSQYPPALRYGLPLLAVLCLVFIVGQRPRQRRELPAR